MDIGFNLLLITHLVAIGVGATTAIGLPIVMLRMRGATPDTQKALGSIANRLGINSRLAFGVLVLSGIAMVWLRYGGVEGMNEWFWVKMSLVVLMAAAIIAGAVLPRGTLNPAIMSWVTRLSFLGIVISAVFAFR